MVQNSIDEKETKMSNGGSGDTSTTAAERAGTCACEKVKKKGTDVEVYGTGARA